MPQVQRPRWTVGVQSNLSGEQVDRDLRVVTAQEKRRGDLDVPAPVRLGSFRVGRRDQVDQLGIGANRLAEPTRGIRRIEKPCHSHPTCELITSRSTPACTASVRLPARSTTRSWNSCVPIDRHYWPRKSAGRRSPTRADINFSGGVTCEVRCGLPSARRRFPCS